MRLWVACAFVALLAGPFAGGVAYALPPADADGDGVTDDVDACPDSAPYELVDATGCSVCDCNDDVAGEPWVSRAAYLQCVFAEVHARRADERLTRRAARLVIRAVRSSTCGSDNLVRCCIPQVAEIYSPQPTDAVDPRLLYHLNGS
jgi:hypothetical protein